MGKSDENSKYGTMHTFAANCIAYAPTDDEPPHIKTFSFFAGAGPVFGGRSRPRWRKSAEIGAYAVAAEIAVSKGTSPIYVQVGTAQHVNEQTAYLHTY